jgi:hypothetical protein
MRSLTTATGEMTAKSFELWQFNLELKVAGGHWHSVWHANRVGGS